MKRIAMESYGKLRKATESYGKAILLSFAFLCLPLHSFASFERQDTGARASGLGGAFAAVGGDVHALFYNPAGLSYLGRNELSSSYGRLFMGLDDGSNLSSSLLLYGAPVKTWGSFGAGWLETDLDSLYKERTLALGYGRSLTDSLAVGAALKQLQVSVAAPETGYDNSGQVTSKADSVFLNGQSARGMGVDIGILYEPVAKHSIGLSLSNINQPEVSISKADSNRIPLLARLGFSRRSSAFMFTSELRTQKLLDDKRDWQGILAGESWKKLGRGLKFAMRGSIAYGSRSFSQLTLGLGCRTSGMELDYAFVMPLSGISFGSTAGTHKFSLSVRFGKTVTHAVSWEIEDEAPIIDAAAMASLRLELEDIKKRAEQAEEMSRQAQEKIKALESARDLELELQKQKQSPNAQAIQPLEAEIAQLKDDLKKAGEESKKMEQKKAIIEGKLEKKESQPRTAPETREKPVSGHTYKVQGGDTLRSIAGKVWGDSSRWIELYRANEGNVQRGGDVEPGQMILIP